MIQIPKLPPSDELEYKEKQFLLSIYEQLHIASKVPFYVLAALIILAYPISFVLQGQLAKYFINRYHPPLVNTDPYHPKPFSVLHAVILPVGAKTYSVYAQIVNPNPEVSARDFQYEFVLRDKKNQVLKKIQHQNFLLAGDSKFIFVPEISLESIPENVAVSFSKIRWTRATPALEIKFEVLQKGSGQDLDGNFFVDGVVRNTLQFGFRKVTVPIMIFDRANTDLVAVNSTELDDLDPLESRYFRVIWPKTFVNFGQIQILPEVNPLQPGFALSKPDKLPAR